MFSCELTVLDCWVVWILSFLAFLYPNLMFNTPWLCFKHAKSRWKSFKPQPLGLGVQLGVWLDTSFFPTSPSLPLALLARLRPWGRRRPRPRRCPRCRWRSPGRTCRCRPGDGSSEVGFNRWKDFWMFLSRGINFKTFQDASTDVGIFGCDADFSMEWRDVPWKSWYWMDNDGYVFSCVFERKNNFNNSNFQGLTMISSARKQWFIVIYRWFMVIVVIYSD